MTTEEIEKIYIDRFQKVFPDFPNGILEFGDKPDLVVKGEKTIGIEITQFYKQDGSKIESEQKQIKFRRQIIEETKAKYLGAGGKKIDLHISFEKKNAIRNVQKVVNGVLEIIPKIVGTKNGIIDYSLHSHLEEIFNIYLNDLGHDNAVWMDLTVNEVKISNIERLNEILARKLVSAKNYKSCDEFWLLICVDYWNPAQDQEIRIEYDNVLRQNVFKKVLLYKTVYEHFVDLSDQSYRE